MRGEPAHRRPADSVGLIPEVPSVPHFLPQIPMPTAAVDVKCPHCGAKVGRDWRSCWLCGMEVPPPIPGEPAAPIFIEKETQWASGHGTARLVTQVVGLMLAMTILMILAGLLASGETGGAIAVVILFVPAGIVTLSKSLSRRAQGESMAPLDKAATFLLSLAVTIGVIVAVCVAAFVALLVVCIAILSSGGGGNMFR